MIFIFPQFYCSVSIFLHNYVNLVQCKSAQTSFEHLKPNWHRQRFFFLLYFFLLLKRDNRKNYSCKNVRDTKASVEQSIAFNVFVLVIWHFAELELEKKTNQIIMHLTFKFEKLILSDSVVSTNVIVYLTSTFRQNSRKKSPHRYVDGTEHSATHNSR